MKISIIIHITKPVTIPINTLPTYAFIPVPIPISFRRVVVEEVEMSKALPRGVCSAFLIVVVSVYVIVSLVLVLLFWEAIVDDG